MRLKLQHVGAVFLLLNGCVSKQPALSTVPGSQRPELSVQFKTAVLLPETAPASYSFQNAKGKRGSAKEGFSDAMELAVSAPAAGVIVPGMVLPLIPVGQDGSEGVWIVAGAVGAVAVVGESIVAPAIAAKGLVRSWKSVSPQELAEREANLEVALKQAAVQQQFQQFLLAKAEEKATGRLLPTETKAAIVDAVLEARIEDLRLERKSADEGTYFLRIKARVRLVRKADDVLLYEQPVEYRSGQALFLDWTMYGSVQGVAETGYRALAEYYASQIF